MQPDTIKIIDCLRDVLARRIIPTVTGPATSTLALVDTALAELKKRYSGQRRQLLVECIQAIETLLASGADLLNRPDRPAFQGGLSWEPPKSSDINEWSMEQIQGRDNSSRNDLDRLVSFIVDQLRPHCKTDWMADARAWINRVVRQEADRSVRTSIIERENPSKEAAASSVDLASYFTAKLKLGDEHCSVNVQELSGGFSRITSLVTIKRPDGTAIEVVLRQEKPRGIIDGVGAPLSREFRVLCLAFENGLPVPEPLWFESDTSIIGAAFIVVKKVPGAVLGSAVDAVGIDANVVSQIAHCLAQLHSIPWQSRRDDVLMALRFPTGRAPTLTEAFEISLHRWTEYLQSSNVDPSPALTAALRLLKNCIPERDIGLSIIHGDVGFHNILFVDGKLNALLDWELADLGDPARDLVNIYPAVAMHVSWEEFIDHYIASGGVPIPEDVARYYSLFLATIGLIIVHVAWESRFAFGSPPEIEFLHLGYKNAPHYFEQLEHCVDLFLR